MLGLRFCARAFSSCGKRGPLFIAVRGPLTIAASLRSTGSRRAGSVIVAHRPSCSAACGIFPDQGSNPCPLHWQADSQPLRHQGSPPYFSTFNSIVNFDPLPTFQRASEEFSSSFLGFPIGGCVKVPGSQAELRHPRGPGRHQPSGHTGYC